MENIKNIDDQVFINLLRAVLNEKTSEKIDTFSGWLIGGFGVTTTLFITQYKSIQDHVSLSGVKWFISFFLIALLCSIVQKIISVIVSNASVGGKIGHELTKEFIEGGGQLDADFILQEIENGMLPIFRKYVSKSFSQARNGDIVAASRKVTKLCQIQGIIAFFQAIITFTAIFIVALSFHA